MRSTTSLALALLAARHSLATLHHIYVSSYSTPNLWTLEFDDNRRTLSLLNSTDSHGGHPAISFSYDRSVIYAGEAAGFSSYSIGGDNPYALTYNASVPLGGTCATTANRNGYGSTAILAEAKGPYMVYGVPLAGCGQSNAVSTDLNLDYISQNFTYNRPTSAVRGLALDPDNSILYSADLGASGIWAHAVNPLTGILNSIGFLPSHTPNAGPRKLIVHPNGRYVYVLLEKANMVALYAVNKPKDGSIPKLGPIAFTGLTYSLLPATENGANYWASDISLSEDGSKLLATTRYRLPSQANSVDTAPVPQPPRPQNPNSQQQQQQQNPRYNSNNNNDRNSRNNRNGRNGRNNNNNDDKVKRSTGNENADKEKRRVGAGYVTAILLTPNSEQEDADTGKNVGSGYPLRVLFQTQTSTSGGMSNSISAAPWGDSFFAITDSEFGVVEVWKIDNLEYINYDGNLGQGALTAAVGGWNLGQWSNTGSLYYSGADNALIAAQQSAAPAPYYPVNQPAGFANQPRPQVPQSYWNGPTKLTPAAPAPTPVATGPWQPVFGGGNGDPAYDYAAPPPATTAFADPAAPWYLGGNGGLNHAQAAPQPSTTSKSWFGNLFGRNAEAKVEHEIEARQVTVAAAPTLPPVSARVFAYWRAPAVQAKFPQGGCCSNPLWYD